MYTLSKQEFINEYGIKIYERVMKENIGKRKIKWYEWPLIILAFIIALPFSLAIFE